ncbi:MAG: hypothetical protein IJX76_06765 [Clostridia bacterium]|nr:hypothetical protein [Clostridia bacterium]
MKHSVNQKPMKKKRRGKLSFRAMLPWIIIIGSLAAILGGVALYTVLTTPDDEWKTEWLVYENGTYTDEKRDITYIPAPFCFESVINAGEDYPYAKSDRWPLYQIGYRDEEGKAHFRPATEWLTTAKSVGGEIYYNPDTVSIPDYADFDWEQIFFSNPGSTSFSTYTLNAEKTDQLMNEVLSEDNEDLYDSGLLDTLDIKLTLRVTSKTYYWLYLNLTVYSDGEGNYYISPEGVKILDDPFLVQVDSSYFDDYLKSMEDILNSPT